jgi:hypothetical protein
LALAAFDYLTLLKAPRLKVVSHHERREHNEICRGAAVCRR